jgi:hypothetical protein
MITAGLRIMIKSEVLAKIECPTVFVKAQTNYDGDLLLAALTDEDAQRVVRVAAEWKVGKSGYPWT